ncbi:hypothetical protein I7I48_11676 [Histoplasma ohiense]|nr:hypothetical protein I7I48_11676 [Histoplasma ohiense (nom. inval.)]
MFLYSIIAPWQSTIIEVPQPKTPLPHYFTRPCGDFRTTLDFLALNRGTEALIVHKPLQSTSKVDILCQLFWILAKQSSGSSNLYPQSEISNRLPRSRSSAFPRFDGNISRSPNSFRRLFRCFPPNPRFRSTRFR